MKSLKTILGLIYPILILLLLLNNCKGIGRNNGVDSDGPVSPLPPPNNVVDTSSVVRDPIDNGYAEPDSTDNDAVRQAETIGESGALKVTLLWNFYADIDLHVKQPNGVNIYYQNKRDASTGGFLDVDNRAGGNGAAENIYWNNPPAGEYIVSLEYYSASTLGAAEAGPCTVVVFQEGHQPVSYEVNMSTIHEFKNVVLINLQ